jgi:hypothetical protein
MKQPQRPGSTDDLDSYGPFPADAVLAVLEAHGIQRARRAADLDPTEEVILVDPELLARLDIHEITLALMAVLPHRKVWVVPSDPEWSSDPIVRG